MQVTRGSERATMSDSLAVALQSRGVLVEVTGLSSHDLRALPSFIHNSLLSPVAHEDAEINPDSNNSKVSVSQVCWRWQLHVLDVEPTPDLRGYAGDNGGRVFVDVGRFYYSGPRDVAGIFLHWANVTLDSKTSEGTKKSPLRTAISNCGIIIIAFIWPIVLNISRFRV